MTTNFHKPRVWMVSSSASFIGRMKTKKPTLLGGGGGCVEICLALLVDIGRVLQAIHEA